MIVRDESVDPPLEFRRGEDYVVDGPAGIITLVPGTTIPRPGEIVVSYVVPQIHNVSPVYTKNIFSSARPLAPKLEYVVPVLSWSGDGTDQPSVRTGNMLRVYMQRPWWTSGDEEKLAVVVWRPGFLQVDPPDELKPLVSMFGFDPVFDSDVTAARPTRFSFPLGQPVDGTTVDNAQVGLTLAETGTVVDIAAHDVRYDPDRDLWYCDIAVNPGNSERSYMPFVRLALARYQPNSLPGVHLSRVVLGRLHAADARPFGVGDRVVAYDVDGSPCLDAATPQSRTVICLLSCASRVELERPGVTDPNLKWATANVRNYDPTSR